MRLFLLICGCLFGAIAGHYCHRLGWLPDLVTAPDPALIPPPPALPGTEAPRKAVAKASFETVANAEEGQALLRVPMPHLVAPGTSSRGLRLAMVHDIIHQRYPIYGEAWFEGRVRYNRSKVDRLRRQSETPKAKQEKKPSDRSLLRLDNSCVALLRLHRDPEAEETMRIKLALMDQWDIDTSPTIPDLDVDRFLTDREYRDEMAMLAERRRSDDDEEVPSHRYTCYANLGTALIHQALKPALSGDPSAKAKLEEGRDWVRKALAHHPGGHGHREVWQLRAVGQLLWKLEDPGRWLERDILGQPLIVDSMATHLKRVPWLQPKWNRPAAYKLSYSEVAPQLVHSHAMWIVGNPKRRWDQDARNLVRSQVMPLYFEAEIDPRAEDPFHAPWDEPVLGILGMWMQGGGANPHFAIGLGGVMERIGQRRIAWSAYARALDLGYRLHKDPDIAASLRAYCLARQDLILKELQADVQNVSAEQLQASFERELNYGVSWQEARWADEESQINAKGSNKDPGDFVTAKAFLRKNGSVASDPGTSDLLTLAAHPAAKNATSLAPPPLAGSVIAVGPWQVITESDDNADTPVAAAEVPAASPTPPSTEASANTLAEGQATSQASVPVLLAHLPGLALGAAAGGLALLLVLPRTTRRRNDLT